MNRTLLAAILATIAAAAKAAYWSGIRTRSTQLAMQGAGARGPVVSARRDIAPLSEHEKHVLAGLDWTPEDNGRTS